MSLIDDILNFFSWDRLNKIFPGGEGVYHLFEIPLTKARTDEQFDFIGDQLIVTDCDSQVYLKLNSIKNDFIDLKIVKQINSPLKKFYLTNSVGTGYLKILAGAGGMFRSTSILPVDLQTNSIGNLPIDLKTNSIGNIPMNINEQGVGDINIDLNTQTIDRVVIRDQDGGIESSFTLTHSIPAGTSYDFKSDSGKGSFKWAMFQCGNDTDNDQIRPEIWIDGTKIQPSLNFNAWENRGADKTTRPFQLLQYQKDIQITGIFYVEKGIPFDSTIKISAYNGAGNPVTVTCWWFYQKI